MEAAPRCLAEAPEARSLRRFPDGSGSGCRRPHVGTWAAVGLWLCCIAAPATAQHILPDQRPGDERQPLPPFEERPAPDAEPILPPYPIPPPEEGGVEQLSTRLGVEVRKIEIEGNSVIPSAVLQEIARPYEGRRLSFADLQGLRDRLTLAYVERGYATSGATLPDQKLGDGVLEVQIVEGKLGDIRVEVAGRFRPSYFRTRLAHSQRGVLNIRTLQEQLQVFQQDPRIEALQARLEPTSRRGISRLELVVKEAPFYSAGADFDNYRSPSIGSLGGTARAGLQNLIGVGDAVHARFTGSEGLRQVEARFEVPFTVWDTRFQARYQYSEGQVVDENFASLGIQSESQSVSFELRQPLYRSRQSQVAALVSADWRRAQSFLFHGAIGLPTLYDEDGKSQASVLRFGLDASYRTRTQSLAFRSLLSLGVGVLGATANAGDVPDGRFVAWLGQLQWASRLPWWDAQLLTRFETQLAADPLLPLEQFAVGGRYTVRGYRENTLVRDNGLAASIELRVPLYRRVDPGVLVELAPFADVGRSWNESRDLALGQAAPQTIGSVGVGARVTLERWGFGELYWGHRLEALSQLGESDLQDDGIHFRLGLSWP